MKNRKSNPNNPILEEYIKIFTCKNQEKGIGVLCKISLKNSMISSDMTAAMRYLSKWPRP